MSEPNPGLANLLLEQFGGPQGELAARRRTAMKCENWRPPAATSRKV
ncbi:hypothetical protein LTSEUGA_2127 [Salmonella enterica subsp. enterica serovar Uganda str. R8-3404]|uniref:Uncharacterized protein n=1 Tax=Salmonella enterica subsp. enterica serovar Uganda str. R8-3404 TaxID=913083 RepID=A0A6C8H341_SALET|nr:hypothetical protein LTSEUGA_2127 [Salmonella enterica subsp. enterica serovar Uganda str. R8-3404]